MEKLKSLLKKPNPQEQLRDWQRRLRQECRNIERQIRDVQREEKGVQKAIREAAKRNDMGSAKALAREIVRSRKAVNRLHENKAQLNSISMHLGESVDQQRNIKILNWRTDLFDAFIEAPRNTVRYTVNVMVNYGYIYVLISLAIARTVGHLSKSAEVMKIVNDLMKAPKMAATMQEFSKEMIKAGVIEEIVNDAVDTALDSEDLEEETEEEVDKVLTELAGEAAAQLLTAVRKERIKEPAQRASASQDEAIAEGMEDEEEMEALRARLAKVRS